VGSRVNSKASSFRNSPLGRGPSTGARVFHCKVPRAERNTRAEDQPARPRGECITAEQGQKDSGGAGDSNCLGACSKASVVMAVLAKSVENRDANALRHSTVSRPCVNEVGGPAVQVGCGLPAASGDITTPANNKRDLDLTHSQNEIKLACLDYIDVKVKGIEHAVPALVDGGSQLNVIDAPRIKTLGLTPVGTILIRGIIGEPV
jgi:hypothetical protein